MTNAEDEGVSFVFYAFYFNVYRLETYNNTHTPRDTCIVL